MRERLQEAIELRLTGHAEEARTFLLDLVAAYPDVYGHRQGSVDQNYSPVLFDSEKPASRDVTETVSTLAHLARFIIVDLTDPSSAPHEVAAVIPQTVVPIQPLLTLQPLMVEGKAVERHEYAMFEDLRRRYHWVLPTFRYQDTSDLLASLQEHIIEPAELKADDASKSHCKPFFNKLKPFRDFVGKAAHWLHFWRFLAIFSDGTFTYRTCS